MATPSVEKGKSTAIIAYITWVGLIIALIMNMDAKNDFAKFHIKQALLLFIFATVLSWIPIIGWIIGIILFVFWIMGLIYAINGEKKEIPLIGSWAQEWFKF